MRVAVVENTVVSHLGQVGVALSEAGAKVEIFQPWNGGALPALDDHDALVVLGGEQSAIDDHTHPYLPALAALMRGFGDAGKSVLGICLGSQILARGYGGDNILGQTVEFGWHDIRTTPAGQDDPVLSAAGEDFPIFEWHSDTFTLPEGAVHLASSGKVSNQAFRIGRAAYGTQFHFEASTTVVDDWRQKLPQVMETLHPGWLEQHPELAVARGVPADAAGLALARAWVATIKVEQAAETRKELLAGE